MRISDWSSDVCSSDLQIGPSRCNERAGGPEMPRRGKVAAVGVARHARKISRRQRILAAAESGEARHPVGHRSEEHTSELQSLMRISYAVFCLKKKKQNNSNTIEMTE